MLFLSNVHISLSAFGEAPELLLKSFIKYLVIPIYHSFLNHFRYLNHLPGLFPALIYYT